MFAEAIYWPMIHMVNYGYVPKHLQVPLLDAAACIFNIYISYISNKKIHDYFGGKQDAGSSDPSALPSGGENWLIWV